MENVWEEYLTADNPLLGYDNVILGPRPYLLGPGRTYSEYAYYKKAYGWQKMLICLKSV